MVDKFSTQEDLDEVKAFLADKGVRTPYFRVLVAAYPNHLHAIPAGVQHGEAEPDVRADRAEHPVATAERTAAARMAGGVGRETSGHSASTAAQSSPSSSSSSRS